MLLDQSLLQLSYAMDRLFWPVWVSMVVALVCVAVRTQRDWSSREPFDWPRLDAVVVLLFLVPYVLFMLWGVAFAYHDNEYFVDTAAGRSWPLMIWPDVGRYFPLQMREFNLLRHISPTPLFYQSIVAVQLMLLCGCYWSRGSVLLGEKDPANERRLADQAKRVGRDVGAEHTIRGFPLITDRQRRRRIRGEPLERARGAISCVDEITIRHAGRPAARVERSHRERAVNTRERESSHAERIHHREEGVIHTEAKTQDEHNRRREAWALAQVAERIPDVTLHVIQPRQTATS